MKRGRTDWAVVDDLVADGWEEDEAVRFATSRRRGPGWWTFRALTLKMHPVRRDVVWVELCQRHVRMALTVLFLPTGYSLQKERA